MQASTDRLRLRPLAEDDAPFYMALVNEPGWIRHIGQRNIHTIEAARTAIAQGAMTMQRERGFSLYLVLRDMDAVPIGICGLIKRDTLPEVDLGYAFLQAYCGHGYAIEAARAVIAHARRDIGLTRLMAITGPDNERSQALLAKLGFVATDTPAPTAETIAFVLDLSRWRHLRCGWNIYRELI